jgi:nucleoside-diphosphate-sugar epimerase
LLGGVLAGALARIGHEVRATGRQPTGPAGAGISYFPADLADADNVASLFRDGTPDAIVHAAARIQADDGAAFARDNVVATATLAEAASRHSIGWCIFFSTISVYSGDGPFAEDSATESSERYGRTKREAERAWLNALDERAIVLRLAGLHGHPRRTGFIYQTAAKALGGVQIELDEPDTQVTPSFIDDVAATVSSILAATRPLPHRIFNLATAESQSYREMATTLCKLLHSDSRIVSKTNARIRNRMMDTTRIRTELHPPLLALSTHLSRMADMMTQAADCA